MAWKKTGKLEWKKVGINEYTIVSVKPMGKRHYTGITHEEFDRPERSFDVNKFFKTKSQALKFAKSYMKKNKLKEVV